MKTRTILSLVIGTIVLFVWNAVSWMALPFHTTSLKNIPEEMINQAAFKEAMPESGVYHFPGMHASSDEEEMQKIEAVLAEGPRIPLMVYVNKSTKLFDPMTFLQSLLVNFLTVLLTYLLIARISKKDKSSILLSALGIGVVAVLVSDLSQKVWFMFPWGYTLVNAMDKVVAFSLLGLVFAFYTFRKQGA